MTTSPTTAAQYAAYANTNHETSSPIRKVIMAFEYMIKYVKHAQEAMKKGHIEERYQDIDRTVTIIETLQNTLDHKQAPELCKTMETYYENMHIRLMSLQYEDDEKVYRTVIRDLHTMLDTWRDVEKNLDDENSQ